jgi:carboxypeptidase-like protein
MAENNNIKNYTAADIERYHMGQLSPEEMHSMEKAALDDPFLADAMEGYKHAEINTGADISSLQDKLKQRIATTNVIELKSKQRSTWLKAAASIIIIIGAGILVYQFAINKQPDNVVKVEVPKQVSTKTGSDSSKPNILTNTNEVAKSDKSFKDEKIKEKVQNKSEKNLAAEYKSDTVNSLSIASEVPSSPVKNDSITDQSARSLAVSGNSNLPQVQKAKKTEDEADGFSNFNKPLAKSRQSQYLNAKVFRGQVLDANNNALPFANITSIHDKVGTYADAKGNFILTSYTDSVLNVQIKSVGYENSIALLRNDLPKNEVILQEDTKNLNEIVVTGYNKKSNSVRRKQQKDIKVEESEPVDGWDNYDTYLINNLNIPDDLQIKSPGNREVEISFNVNKNGDPVNIKVEKSLCKECDIEAIRLIKEGPKWKKNGKKSRGSVTVPF